MAHLRIEIIKELPKTNIYSVESLHDYSRLGIIKWHPQWRRYCFFPETEIETLWSDDCLLEVYNFIHKLKLEGKNKPLTSFPHKNILLFERGQNDK